MFKSIISACSPYKSLSLGALGVGLETRVPLDSDSANKGLAAIQKEFPELTESSYAKDGQTFRLQNSEKATEKQILFRLAQQEGFDFSWGPLARFGAEVEIKRLYDCLQNGFGIPPINVDLVDVKAHFACDVAMNHYEAIWRTFFLKSCVAPLLEPHRILEDDLRFRLLLDDNRVCAVTISSNVGDDEVRSGTFENDKLKVRVGIAQVGSISLNAMLSTLAVAHIGRAVQFIEHRVIPYVVAPLDATLGNLRNLSGAS